MAHLIAISVFLYKYFIIIRNFVKIGVQCSQIAQYLLVEYNYSEAVAESWTILVQRSNIQLYIVDTITSQKDLKQGNPIHL